MQANDTMSADRLLAMGLAASKVNDSANAIAWFERASAAAPDKGLPHFLRGSEYAFLGDMGKAEEAFAAAVLLSPDLTAARYQLGLLQFSSERATTALLTWSPLLALPATDPLPHFIRGFGALAQDRFEEAIGHYSEGLELNISNPAMSSDIRKIMAGIRALQPAGSAEDHAAAPAPSEAQTHVLLSNYQQQGRPH